jgi:hypothetical protein
MSERLATIKKVAWSVLEQNPGPIVRYRLLRDVLCRPADDPERVQAQKRLKESRCVRELAGEQWPDGGWGRFHSRDTRHKQRIPTTEAGVERALALGLDRSHPILHKASRYIVDIMNGERPFPDPHEQNDRWPAGMRLFLASTLSLIQPDHPLLDQDRRLWLEIARRALRSGVYREEDEIQAHAGLTGATVKNSYLVLDGRYQLNVLGSMPGMLSEELESALLRWLWTRPHGIGYLEVPLYGPPPCHKPGSFDRWLASLELLARLFPAWVHFARESIEWLWAQRNDQGLWDLGPRSPASVYLPLSDSWRRRQNRVYDWTTRVLILLGRAHRQGYLPGCDVPLLHPSRRCG